VAGDEEGVIRVFEYDPTSMSWYIVIIIGVDCFYIYLDVESQGGQRLILGTEFHAQSECRTSLTTVCRTKTELPQSRLLCGEDHAANVPLLLIWLLDIIRLCGWLTECPSSCR
jgi:hypothetical protein